jgi:hypothetical protein
VSVDRVAGSTPTRVLCVVSLLLATGCGGGRRASLDDYARQYVRLAVALGERDPDSLDFYAGPAELVADIRRQPPPLTAIRADAAQMAARLSGCQPSAAGSGASGCPVPGVSDEGGRQRMTAIARDLTAIIARVDLLRGTRLPFDRESVAFFGIAPGPVDDDRLAAIRARIAAVVGGSGRLVDRYAAFAARFIIAGDRLQPVLAAALEACREATRPHLRLPAGESAALEFVDNKPWAAYSRFLGHGRSVIQINRDFQLTVDQALQIACHEGYPGHHARSVARTAGPAARWLERSVQLTFSPESFVAEAAGMAAVDVAFAPDARLATVRDRLFPLAGLPADGAAAHVAVERLVGQLQVVQADVARRYLDGAIEFERAVSELEERALVPHAEALVKYINEYRSYVATYTAGASRFAARCSGQTSEEARWQCYLQDLASP